MLFVQHGQVRCVCSDEYLVQILIAAACTGVSEFWFLGWSILPSSRMSTGFFVYVLGTLSTKGISRFT